MKLYNELHYFLPSRNDRLFWFNFCQSDIENIVFNIENSNVIEEAQMYFDRLKV